MGPTRLLTSTKLRMPVSESVAVRLRALRFVVERETAQIIGSGPSACAKWKRMWDRSDNQEVGLEAAILERVRNSSLVKWFRADNVAGLKHTAEAVAFTRVPAGSPFRGRPGVWMGRGASRGGGSGGGIQPWTPRE